MATTSHHGVEGPTLVNLEDKIFKGNRFSRHMHNHSDRSVASAQGVDEGSVYSSMPGGDASASSHITTTGSITWWVAKKRAEILYSNQSVYNPEFTEDLNTVYYGSSTSSPIAVSEKGPVNGEPVICFKTTKVVADLIKSAAANKALSGRSGPHSTIGTVKGWNAAVQSVSDAALMLQKQFRKRIARNRVMFLKEEKAMRWRIINMLLRFVRRFRLKQHRATKLRASLRLQSCVRSFLARKRVLRMVSAGIKIVSAYKRYLQVSHMRFALRRILRPVVVKLRDMDSIPLNALADRKIKIRINVWWHSVLHMANSSDVIAILQTKKPSYSFMSQLYRVHQTDTNQSGEPFGKVEFVSKSLVQHKLGVLGTTSHLTKALVTGAAGAAGTIVHGTAGVVRHSAGAVIQGTQSLLHKTQSPDNSSVRVSEKEGVQGVGSPHSSGDESSADRRFSSKSRKVVVDEKEDCLSIIIPACHSNCYVRIDLMDEMGRVVAAYTYAMKKRGNLMFWGIPKGETTSSLLMPDRKNGGRETRLPGGGAVGLHSSILAANYRGSAKVAPMATLKESGSASGEGSCDNNGVFKPISVPLTGNDSEKSKKLSLVGGARGSGRKMRSTKASGEVARHTSMRWHISPGIQCTWALVEVSGRGPLSHKAIPLTGAWDMAIKALEERGYMTKRKNYTRFMLCLMQDELLFCSSRTDSSPEMSFKLVTVVNISAELSPTTCYMYQIDPTVKAGIVGAGLVGSVMRKVASVFDTDADLKTGIGGHAIDSYDVVLELSSGDVLSLR